MKQGGAFLLIVAGVIVGWMAITGRLQCGLASIRCGFLGTGDAGCQSALAKCQGGTASGATSTTTSSGGLTLPPLPGLVVPTVPPTQSPLAPVPA